MSNKDFNKFFISLLFLIAENEKKFKKININNENLVRKIFNYIIEKQSLETFNNFSDKEKIKFIKKIIKEIELDEMVEELIRYQNNIDMQDLTNYMSNLGLEQNDLDYITKKLQDTTFNFNDNNNNINFTIITLKGCPSCNNAKKMLKEFNLKYTEIPADNNKEKYNKEMNEKCGIKFDTFPKIFINDNNFIGGFTDLKKMLNNKMISLPTLIEDSSYGIFFIKFLKNYGIIFRKYILIDENETEFEMYGVKKKGMKNDKFKNEYIINKILGEKNISAKIFSCKIIDYIEYKKHISNSLIIDYNKEELLNKKFKNKKFGYIDMEFLKNHRTISRKDIENKKIKNKILKKISEIHNLGIRHCDLHLQNIMINNDNEEIKIIDFSNSLRNKKKVSSKKINDLIKEEEIEKCDKYKNFRSNFKL